MNTTASKTYKIEGMTCAHCQRNIEKALSSLPGVTAVEVSLQAGTATVTGNVDPDTVRGAIEEAGYEVKP